MFSDNALTNIFELLRCLTKSQITRYKLHLTYILLWLKDLRVSQWEKPCIEFTQENSIENSVQDHLPYISQTTGLYTTALAYPKWPCICLKATMYITYNMTSFLSEPSTIFHYGTWLCDSMAVTCDIPLIPNSSPKNRIDWKKKKRKEKKIR